MDKAQYIWMDGKLVAWDDAKIHILTHTLHYGNGVFEGTRAYMTDEGLAIFKLREHTKRLLNSAKITRIKPNFTLEEIESAHVRRMGDLGEGSGGSGRAGRCGWIPAWRHRSPE